MLLLRSKFVEVMLNLFMGTILSNRLGGFLYNIVLVWRDSLCCMVVERYLMDDGGSLDQLPIQAPRCIRY